MTHGTYLIFILAALWLCLILLAGCAAETRYKTLSFFFDGVPLPGDHMKPGEGAAGASPDGGGGRKKGHPSIHGPYAAKMCDACHQAETNRLLLPKEELCLKCHTFPPVRRQHGPLAAGGCLACHDPHRSGNQFLLVSEAKIFCMHCHDPKDIYSHEAHQGRDLVCTECHSPHGSDNEYLLR